MTRGWGSQPGSVTLVLLALAVSTCLASCGGPPVAQPPDMQYGLEECAACRMIVSEPRHAAAVVYADGRIERFDDVGCMVRHLREALAPWPSPADAQIWVQGSHGQWLDARGARFVYDASVTTPMGYGWLAYEESRAGAELLRLEQLSSALSMSQTTR